MTLSIISNLVREFYHRRWQVKFFCLGAGIGGLLFLSTLVVISCIHYQQHIAPKVYIGPVAIGELTLGEAHDKLALAVRNFRQHWPLIYHIDETHIDVSMPDTAVHYDLAGSLSKANQIGHPYTLPNLIKLTTLWSKKSVVPVAVTIDSGWLTNEAATIAAQVDIPTVPPTFTIQTLNGEKQAVVVPGKNGRHLNQDRWKAQLTQALQNLQTPSLELPVETDSATMSADQVQNAVKRANALLKTSLTLSLTSDSAPPQTWQLTGADLVKFVRFDTDFDNQLIADYVQGLSEAVNQSPKDAKFQFDEASGKVNEFVPAENGITVSVDKTTTSIEAALTKLSQNESVSPVTVIVDQQEPNVTLAEVNRLGIKERLGVGTSLYYHSSDTRMHNVQLAAARINGTLIKPGDEFSFNAAVGEVDAQTGYQQAYVIREGKTQLDDGGGVCQDSTTVFRAALNAGLPITMRRGHAYRVGYYEEDSKPGFDATVFAPSTDFQFLNDTPAYILVQTVTDPIKHSLAVYLYGTSDGRKATISDYALWNVTPPPPDVYTDDPTLPAGTIKQIDFKAVGSNAKFTYTVERAGQTIFEKTFMTVYQPWAAVYLRGTK